MQQNPKIIDVEVFNIFGDEHNRFDFPADIHRVTSGSGGETYLIFGSEKTALYDCGMAYCGRYTVENIRNKLVEKGRDRLDYVFLSHSHYDHMGALPYIREAFPKAVVYGSERCKSVLGRAGARKVMKELGTAARELYMPGNDEEILVDNLVVDAVLHDGDRISLGEETITALETKGHTDCSMSYVLEPVKLMFASESTGMMEGAEYIHTPFLKDYKDAVDSLEKCRTYDAEYICLPHFGMLPKDFNDTYWQMLEDACNEKYEFIKELKDMQLDDDEMYSRYVEKYWNPGFEEVQPKDAFLINSKAILKAFLKHM